MKLIWSFLILAADYIFNTMYWSAATIVNGEAATKQLLNSDMAYATSQATFSLIRGVGLLSTLITLGLLLLVWSSSIKELLIKMGALALVFGMFVGMPNKSYAYWDKYDYTEAIYALPNQSLFIIPDVGANKESQAKFGSQEYYDQNKIASKRVVIPHAKLSGSGTWSDFYVPAARAIIVDRTPFNKQWVTASDRGTSKNNEGFYCQSSEGLDITLGISISAIVNEEDAAKYLYYFGTVAPVGDPKAPEVVFTSVYYGRSVASVMDSVVHGKVQASLCKEISKRTLDKANLEASIIIDAVEKDVKAAFAPKGITIDYLGYADTFTFSKSVQDAINKLYASGKEAEIAARLGPVIDTITRIEMLAALNTMASKFDKIQMPSMVIIPDSLGAAVSNIIKSAPKPPVN